jgi:hypothetical protein
MLAALDFFLRLLVREPSRRIASLINSFSFMAVPGGAFLGGAVPPLQGIADSLLLLAVL